MGTPRQTVVPILTKLILHCRKYFSVSMFKKELKIRLESRKQYPISVGRVKIRIVDSMYPYHPPFSHVPPDQLGAQISTRFSLYFWTAFCAKVAVE